MKRPLKILLPAIALAFCMSAFAGCKNSQSGEAYGLVHGGNYVGCATIAVSGEKVDDATINEVCLPTYVEAGEEVPESDKVANGESSYYKTVSYSDITLTYADDSYKTADGKTLNSLLSSETEAKKYFQAVMENSVYVTVNGQKKGDILTKETLCKEYNGYWTRTDKNGNKYSRWKMNRDATVTYVKEHGVADILKLVKSDSPEKDSKEDKDAYFWKSGSLSTGATWVDLNPAETEGYISYAKLLVNAYANAKKQT